MADAITGRYEADFSQYKSETQSAASQLRLFEAEADKAAVAVARVTTSAPKGFEQFSATTVNTRKEMAAMAATAGTTTNAFSTLGTGLGAADKTLAAFGFHIGPEIHALNELGEIANRNVSSLGALGTATGVAAAAFAGWNIGRKIAEVFDLDTKIASLADRMFDLGVATETAAAKQDSIDRAIANGADKNIEYADAVKYNIKHQNDFADSLNTSQHRLSQWQGEIRRLRGEGTLAALEADIKSGNSTIAEMAKQYGITERTVEYFSRTLDEHARAQDRASAATKKAADEAKAQQEKLDQIAAAQREHIQETHDSLYGGKDIQSAKDYAAAIGDVSGATLLATVNASGAAKAAEILWQAEQRMILVAVEAGTALNPLVEEYERLRLALTSNARAELDDAAATAANTAEKRRLNEEMERAFKESGGTDVEGFRSGFVPTGTSHMQPFVGLKPSVFAGSGVAGVNTPGTVINNTFNVNGTGEEIARVVGDRMTQQAMIGGPRDLGR